MTFPVALAVSFTMLTTVNNSSNFLVILAGHHRASGAIRIIQIQQRCLNKGVGRAQAHWMRGIAFDLGGTTFVALDQDAKDRRTQRHCRRVVRRQANDHILGSFGVRKDLLLGTPTASQTREC